MSLLLRAYLAFSAVSDPIWRWTHKKRLTKGKEIAKRLPEKYGYYRSPRPTGTVIWLHALSVGESLALLPLIEKALAVLPDVHVVLTTSTATSVAALEKAGLPDRATHVFLPIDTARAVGRFLDHWAPDVAGFAELDFWPRMMVDTHRREIPMVLINSRMPQHNFDRRRKLGGIMRDVLGLFDALLVQDDASRDRFVQLGAPPERIRVVGALKSAARPLPCDDDELARLRAKIGTRPVWLAAATIADEHPSMVETHVRIQNALPDALMIIAPRHAADGDALETMARAQFQSVARRSAGGQITAETQVYIADTIGEMGLWYRLAPVSFVGHSLDVNKTGLEGKNPFEAAALGSAILHGAGISYFEESYRVLKEEGGAQQIDDVASLSDAILSLQDESVRRQMTAGAQRVIKAQSAVLTNTWDAIAKHLG